MRQRDVRSSEVPVERVAEVFHLSPVDHLWNREVDRIGVLAAKLVNKGIDEVTAQLFILDEADVVDPGEALPIVLSFLGIRDAMSQVTQALEHNWSVNGERLATIDA